MVTLHSWFPPTPFDLIKLVLPPDFGHSTLQVVDDESNETYVSFWPEPATLAGEFAHHFRVPAERFPSTYTVEIDPAGHYMRRPSDENDQIEGLDTARIASAWKFLAQAHYDLQHWNCANVTKFLILYAMDEKYFFHLEDAARLTAADMREISNFQQVRAIVRYLATRNVIDTRPDDVVHLVQVYNRLRTEGIQ